jgi:uncharacterized lipoprotein
MRNSSFFYEGSSMAYLRFVLVIVACSIAAGCSKDLTCDDPQQYELAQEGTRIDAPEDLDQLQASRELTVPHASPREARPEGSPCLDLPPALEIVK